MSRSRLPSLVVVLALALWAFRTETPAAQASTQTARDAAHATVVVVVNTENPVTQLSIGDLRRMLLGEMTRWPNGKTVTIAMRPPGQPERDAVFRLVCGLTESDFARYQLRAAYRGEAQSGIKQLDTPVGVKRFVFNVPGAIGFVRGDEVDPTVKRLSITGDVPTEPAFGLTLRAK
jgi:ABC-type phosphate transport system substrate-binding protein